MRPGDRQMLKLFVGQYSQAPRQLSAKAVRKLAVEVYEYISNAKRWEFGLPRARCVVEWEGPSYAFSRLTTPDWRAAFRLRVTDLLSAHARWIRKCERAGCGRVFLADKRQVFCSSKCAQRVRFARYWKKLSSQERYEKRHEHYAETVRRKYGSARVIRKRTLKSI